MAVVTVAIALSALADILAGSGFAVYSHPESFDTAKTLITADRWFSFVGAFFALVAVCVVAWNLFLKEQWTARTLELVGAASVTFLFAIGLLIDATQPLSTSQGANVVAAIGVGGWSVLLLIEGAQRSLMEQRSPELPRQATLQLLSSLAIALLAVRVGLTTSLTDEAPVIAGSAFAVVGFTLLAWVIARARTRAIIVTRQVPILVASLALFVLAEVAFATGSGIVQPQSSFTAVQVAGSVSAFIQAVAFLVLAITTFGRVAELSLAGGTTPTGVPSASGPPPPSWNPDPSHHHEVRWWDGERWSEHVMDAGRPSIDPPGLHQGWDAE